MTKRNLSSRALHRTTKTKQAVVVRRINQLLAAEGIAGRIRELHLDVPASASDCPPGTRKRTVCRKQPDGRIVCREECV
jgi:hypothetical protein